MDPLFGMDPVARLSACPTGFGIVPPDDEDTRETLHRVCNGLTVCVEAAVHLGSSATAGGGADG